MIYNQTYILQEPGGNKLVRHEHKSMYHEISWQKLQFKGYGSSVRDNYFWLGKIKEAYEART